MGKKVKMHTCVEVDKHYAASAAKSYQAVVEVDASPEQVFEVFEDADAWPAWATPIKKVIWTSPKPYGLGTTRTVEMIGLVGDETFIAWDYPKHMAFCFTQMSESLIESFAEDYVVTPLGNGKTRVQWTMAMTPRGYGKVTMALFGPMMGIGLQFMLNGFKTYTDQRFA
jgi:uncharacterized protein YndB with AHSA1/START domain